MIAFESVDKSLKPECTRHGRTICTVELSIFRAVSSVPGRLRLDGDPGVVHQVPRQADRLVPQGFDHLGKALRLDLRQRAARGASAIQRVSPTQAGLVQFVISH